MSTNVATEYSAGIILHRVALSASRKVALSEEGQEFTYSELASMALGWMEVFEKSYAENGCTAVSYVAPSPIDQIASTWGALLSRCPLALGNGNGFDDPEWLQSIRRPISTPQLPYPSHRAIISPQPGDAPALLFPVLDGGNDAVVWTQKALALSWAICSPPPGSVGVHHRPLSGPSTWSSSFGVFVGRGRAVVKLFAPKRAWLEALDGPGVTDVHLTIDEAHDLGGLCDGANRSVRRLFVWNKAAIDRDVLSALTARFTSASVSRILESPSGPVTVATFDELTARGMDWIGHPVLGTELTVGGTRGSSTLIASSICGGSIVSRAAQNVPENARATCRWQVRLDSHSSIFLEKDGAYD
ncbi:MAG: hypothetical protein M3O31_13650 [Acidobacteriota bacterium]|nr:hypothetical protein [Acidobacteriota bacterium]